MAQVMAALGHRCSSFRSDSAREDSVPLIDPVSGVCTVSQPQRHAKSFNCFAKPPTSIKAGVSTRRLCWCSHIGAQVKDEENQSSSLTDIWTQKPTGCKCYFNETRSDCACCSVGACQCSAVHRSKCVPCGAMWKCVVSEDQSGMQELQEKQPRSLIAALNFVVQAKTYESQQQGIREYLKEVYRLPQTSTKVQMVGLLSEKLSEVVPDANVQTFEFPEGNEVEDWLSSLFLEEELNELMIPNATEGVTKNVSKPSILGLVSLGASVQEKFQACDWQVALAEFYNHGGGYGNWCGKQPKINGIPQPFGGCVHKKGRNSEQGNQLCKDSGLDAACFRHDSGGYSEDLWGKATKSLCKVDGDFQLALQNISMSSTFIDGLDRTEVKA